jgi:hypothetical protein
VRYSQTARASPLRSAKCLPFLMPPTPPTTTPKNQLNIHYFCVTTQDFSENDKKNVHKDSISKSGQ